MNYLFSKNRWGSICLLAMFFLIGCYTTPECVDMPLLADSGPTDSETYQAKVREILRNYEPEDFRYIFDHFIDEDAHSFMMTSFRNEKVCLEVKVLVNKWDKLGGMKRHNGKAYPNELVNLKWTIKNIDGYPYVVYEDMRRIID